MSLSLTLVPQSSWFTSDLKKGVGKKIIDKINRLFFFF